VRALWIQVVDVTDLFPVEDGEMKVVDLAGGFQPIKPPEGVSVSLFRAIVSAIHTYFLHEKVLPGFDDLLAEYPRFNSSKDRLLTTWRSDELAQALRYRGLQWNSDGGLTIQQEHTLMALSDPTDKRSQAAILRAVGVSGTTFRTWMKSPLFADKLHRASVANYEDFLPLARNALIQQATEGKLPAIELLFQITGEWSPETQAIGDLKAVMQTLIESIVRNVHDPEAKAAILADAEAALLTLRLSPSSTRALER
jgi:hypothetical protein